MEVTIIGEKKLATFIAQLMREGVRFEVSPKSAEIKPNTQYVVKIVE